MPGNRNNTERAQRLNQGVDPERNPWERRDDETTIAYSRFKAFLLAGPERTLIEIYRRESNKPRAQTVSGTWIDWARKYEWQARCKAYDDHVNRLAFEKMIAEQSEAYAGDLENFRKTHAAIGKKLMSLAMKASLRLDEYLDTKPKITNIDDAKKMSSLINDALRYAPTIWAEALGVPELQAMLETMNLAKEEPGG